MHCSPTTVMTTETITNIISDAKVSKEKRKPTSSSNSRPEQVINMYPRTLISENSKNKTIIYQPDITNPDFIRKGEDSKFIKEEKYRPIRNNNNNLSSKISEESSKNSNKISDDLDEKYQNRGYNEVNNNISVTNNNNITTNSTSKISFSYKPCLRWCVCVALVSLVVWSSRGSSHVIVSLVLGFLSLLLLKVLLRTKYSYWASHGVQTSPPAPIIGHTLKRLGISMPFTQFFDQLYLEYGGRDFCGYYDFVKPGLFVGNPELVKRILVQDFEHFQDRRTFDLGKVNPIANDMLTNATGDHWRYIRSVISPAFTAGKTRRLFPLINQRGQHLAHLARDYACTAANNGRGGAAVEARSLCGRFTMDTIASCAFGIECESMSSEAATFPEMASRIFQLSPTRAIKILILLVAPRVAELIQNIGIDFTSPEFHFFRHVVTHTLRLRSEQGIRRGDFLDLMMETRANGKQGLSDNAMVAQAILFLLAGYDNTANTLSLALYNLAINPQAQAALRRELAAAGARSPDGSSINIDHKTLMDLPYLDAVVNETLRLYPAAPVIERICTKNYRLGGSSIHLQKGQPLLVPVWSLHRDPHHWPQPHLFKPQRFLGEDKQAIRPYTFIPFGKGPRSCIGFRFAMLTIKVGLAHLLLDMQVERCERTLDPLPLDPKVLTLQPKDGVYVALNAFNTDLKTHLTEELIKYPPTITEDPEILATLQQHLGITNSSLTPNKRKSEIILTNIL